MSSDKFGGGKVGEAPICFAALSTVQSPSQANAFFLLLSVPVRVTFLIMLRI